MKYLGNSAEKINFDVNFENPKDIGKDRVRNKLRDSY